MNKVEERDVIVVGAGPAGAVVATILAQKKHDVLLLDKHNFPRDKVCGDGFVDASIEILNGLGMADKIRKEGFHRVNGMRIVSRRGNVLDLKVAGGYVAPRLRLDAIIQGHAVESGAEFLQATVLAPIVKDGRVAGVKARINGEVKDVLARVVIGADGSNSVLAHALNKERQKPENTAVALRAYIEDIELTAPDRIEMFMSKDIDPGYAWIFPMGNRRANIGVGTALSDLQGGGKRLSDMLNGFLAMPGIRKRLGPSWRMANPGTWILNLGIQKNVRRAFDGAVLVGDAASLVDPLDGGGILDALISAQLAADVTHEALSISPFSSRHMLLYGERCKTAFDKYMLRQGRLKTILSEYPFILELIIMLGGKSGGLLENFISRNMNRKAF